MTEIGISNGFPFPVGWLIYYILVPKTIEKILNLAERNRVSESQFELAIASNF